MAPKLLGEGNVPSRPGPHSSHDPRPNDTNDNNSFVLVKVNPFYNFGAVSRLPVSGHVSRGARRIPGSVRGKGVVSPRAASVAEPEVLTHRTRQGWGSHTLKTDVPRSENSLLTRESRVTGSRSDPVFGGSLNSTSSV